VNDSHLTLVTLTEELRSEFFALAEDYLAAGEDRYRAALDDFHAYVRSLRDGERGPGSPGGSVPHSTFWLSAGRRLLGRATLRHYLTPELEHEGGHIGYDVRPSERRKGYGTVLLKLTLEKARGLGLRRVMLSCDSDNIGSAKVIERNGGRLESQASSGRSGKRISRYWIEL
jgi:predicted acetyltransferase